MSATSGDSYKERSSVGVEVTQTSPAIDERKLIRKIDLRLIPLLTLLYLLSFLDRGSIGNARLYGLEQDLHISDQQYLWALTVFFFPYAIFEPVSNVLLRRFRPSIYLPSMMMAWGTVMALHGVVRNYGGLLTVRIMLGLTEAGLYPGVVFYLSSWYRKNEIGLRIAIFFSAATVAGAFSGLLAAAISDMNGVGSLAAWRWIFILEGLLTVVVAFASYWLIQDFPATAKFLSEAERDFVIRRLMEDAQLSAGGEKYRARNIWQSLTDWKTWIYMGLFTGFLGPLYAFALFLPTILSQLGFRATAANLLTVPVYTLGCISTCAVGFAADRTRNRSYFNLCFFSIGIAGYIILVVSRTPSLSYFAVFLAASGIYPTVPNSAAWIASNFEGSYKRAVTLGFAIGVGNLNGAVTSNVYRAKDSPWYSLGHGIVLAYLCIGWISTFTLILCLNRENRARSLGKREEIIFGVDNPLAKEENGSYETVQAAIIDKGDRWSGFRYSL